MNGKLKYIVLGGNGFIGKNLCQYLYKQGCEVTSFDRDETTNRIVGINYIKADFFDDADLRAAIEDKDVIIHAISTINPGNSNQAYLKGYEGDFIQTIKMCTWIKDANKKVVFISSGGTVYGKHDKDELTEDVLPNPINHYGNVKLSIENALRIFRIQDSLKIIIARISNPYGPGQDFTKGVGFIDAVLKQSIDEKTVEIWGDGSVIRDYIYIEDVCQMLFDLIQYKGEEYLFNISSGVGVSQNDIVKIVQNIGLDVKVEYKEPRSVDVPKIILNNNRIRGLYKMSLITIDEGIKRYFEYLCNERRMH